MKIRFLKHYLRNFTREVLRDPERKNLLALLSEYLLLLVINPEVSRHYFKKFLYRRGARDYGNYMVTEKVLHKCWDLNDPDYISILGDKYLFEHFFARRNVAVVKTLAHNCNTLFFTGDESVQICSPDDFAGFLKSFLQKGDPEGALIIKKRKDSSGGSYVYRISGEDLASDPDKIDQVFGEVMKSEFIIQDFLNQHHQLDLLNPYCVNTIRMDTFTDRNGFSRLYSAFIRLGTSRAHTDNISSGGMFIKVDLETGKLGGEAFSDFSHGRARYLREYLENGVRFKDHLIPFMNEAMDLVVDAASKVPQLPVIGWDVAITEDGPVLIEGNEHPGITSSELVQRGMGRNTVFLDILEEIRQRELEILPVAEKVSLV